MAFSDAARMQGVGRGQQPQPIVLIAVQPQLPPGPAVPVVLVQQAMQQQQQAPAFAQQPPQQQQRVFVVAPPLGAQGVQVAVNPVFNPSPAANPRAGVGIGHTNVYGNPVRRPG